MFTTSSNDNSLPPVSNPLIEEIEASHAKPSIGDPNGARSRPLGLQKNWGLLRKLKRASLIAQQKGLLEKKSGELESSPDGLAALQEVARRGEQKKAQMEWHQEAIAPLASEATVQFAAPLSSLKERDKVALVDFFQRDDLAEIEADVSRCLLRLMPEPCWEDNILSEILKLS